MDPAPTPSYTQSFTAYTHRFATVKPYHMRYCYSMLFFLVLAAVLAGVQQGLWVAALIGAVVCFWVQYFWRGEY
jgi:hypothetical protein